MHDTGRRPAAPLSGGSDAALAVLLAALALVAIGCGSSVVEPIRSGAPGASTSAPPPGTPRPTPTPDPAAAAIDGFVALVTARDFSYQATFSGQDRHSTDILPVRDGLLQVSGANVLVRATFSFPSGGASVVEHRVVGGKAWIRFDRTEPWKRTPFKAADSPAAFAAVRTKADVTYLGPVKSGGTTFYQVSFRSAIVNPVMIPAVNLSETALTTPKLTLVIDAEGRPVKGTAEVDGKGRVSGQLQEIVIELDVAFVKVGQPVAIKAP